MREKNRLPWILACLLLALAVAACGRDGDSGPSPTSPGVTDVEVTAGAETNVESTAETVTVAGGEAVRITDSPVEDEMPAVSGDRVVWVNGNPLEGPRSVFLHNLSEGTTRQIVPDDGDPIRPDIDGDVVAWEDGRDFRTDDIFALDLSTGEQTRITARKRSDRIARVSGDRVVWEHRPGFLVEGFDRSFPGPGDIFVHDLSSGTTTAVANDPDVNEQNGDISGDRVVWANGDRVMVRNLTQGTTRQVASGASSRPIVISGSRIAFTGDVDGDGQDQVIVINLETGNQRSIAPIDNPIDEVVGGLSEDHLVWTDERNGDFDIVFHDLATGETRRLTDHPADQVEADVDGDRVVWKDLRSGDGDIFMLELRVTIDQIRDRVEELRASGAIDNRGVANSLRKILDKAAAARERGNLRAARNQLRAFIQHVEAQAGKHISRDGAEELIGLARQAIEDLEDP